MECKHFPGCEVNRIHIKADLQWVFCGALFVPLTCPFSRACEGYDEYSQGFFIVNGVICQDQQSNFRIIRHYNQPRSYTVHPSAMLRIDDLYKQTD